MLNTRMHLDSHMLTYMDITYLYLLLYCQLKLYFWTLYCFLCSVPLIIVRLHEGTVEFEIDINIGYGYAEKQKKRKEETILRDNICNGTEQPMFFAVS